MGCTASHHILHQNHCKYILPHTVSFWEIITQWVFQDDLTEKNRDETLPILTWLLCPKLLSLEKPFEFIWNLKSSFEIWKFNSNLTKFFRAICMYSSLSLIHTHCITPWGPCLELIFKQDEIFSYSHYTFKFQKIIWDLKEIQKNFQDIKVFDIIIFLEAKRRHESFQMFQWISYILVILFFSDKAILTPFSFLRSEYSI